jgi:hypothetical protein
MHANPARPNCTTPLAIDRRPSASAWRAARPIFRLAPLPRWPEHPEEQLVLERLAETDRGCPLRRETLNQPPTVKTAGIATVVRCNRLHDIRGKQRNEADSIGEAGATRVLLACTELPIALAAAPHPACIDATEALARSCLAWWQARQS